MNDFSIFDRIAEQNGWGSAESISGPGSTLEATASLRAGLVSCLEKLNIRSLVDAPCGDFNWMRHLPYSFERYIGIDIAPFVINGLSKLSMPPEYSFQLGNLVTDILPKADAILCRDCLVHLPFDNIFSAMELWKKAGFRYMMATTFHRFPGNADCAVGDWRQLNLTKAPFDLPEPLMLIADNDLLPPPYDDKSLGVWDLGA